MLYKSMMKWSQVVSQHLFMFKAKKEKLNCKGCSSFGPLTFSFSLFRLLFRTLKSPTLWGNDYCVWRRPRRLSKLSEWLWKWCLPLHPLWASCPLPTGYLNTDWSFTKITVLVFNVCDWDKVVTATHTCSWSTAKSKWRRSTKCLITAHTNMQAFWTVRENANEQQILKTGFLLLKFS